MITLLVLYLLCLLRVPKELWRKFFDRTATQRSWTLITRPLFNVGFTARTLTEVEHVCCSDKGHEVDPRGEGHHAEQDEQHVVHAAPKHDEADEAGEEDHAARRLSVSHLQVEENKQGRSEPQVAASFRHCSHKSRALTWVAVQLSGSFITKTPSRSTAPTTAVSYNTAATNSSITFTRLVRAGASAGASVGACVGTSS